MYSEFIIIYLLLFVVIALLIAVLIVTLKSSNGRHRSSFNSNNVDFSAEYPDKHNIGYSEMQSDDSFNKNNESSTSTEKSTVNAGVVFCTKCAHQYSANDKFCPNCGHSRD